MPHEVPSGWVDTRLGEHLIDIRGGGTPARDIAGFWNGPIPWASVKDVTAGVRTATQESITVAGLKASASSIASAGTIVLATRMAVGKSVRFTVDVAINQDLKALIPRPTLSADFLHAWLHGHEAEIAASATGSTVKGIRVGHLEGMHLLLPPLPEQKKIAAILSSVDEAIQATQLVIEQTRRVKEGLLQDLLTRGLPGHERFKQTVIGEIPESWEVVHLQQACSHIVDCPHSTPVYEEDGVPCIRTADLDRDGLHVERAFRVSEATYATRTVRLIPELGDIIYSREGERFGIAAPVGHERVCLGQRVMQFRAAEDMVPKFLLAVLNSASVYQQAASCVGSTTAPHVNIEDIRRFRIPKPPYPEQAAIADAVEPLIVTIREGKEQLPALHRLKAGLLQDLLTGKVRVSP